MIRQRIALVRERIARACERAGRDPGSVRLVAVSKTHPASLVREAYEAGLRMFGENYAQEWLKKADTLSDLPDLAWHFVGDVQSNKAKYLADRIAMVHALSSVDAAQALSRRRTVSEPLSVLVHVNVAREPQKHGLLPEQLPELLNTVRALPRLRVVGLMTIPPKGGTEAFRALRMLRDTEGLSELSMGMSGDLEDAIFEGATLVRVGTDIFGTRATPGG